MRAGHERQTSDATHGGPPVRSILAHRHGQPQFGRANPAKRCSPAFFVQAECGIRDDLVTGVQTCALPIFNFIDGLDGLAAGLVAIAGLFITIISWTLGQNTVAMLAAIFTGAVAGFLPHNWNPARVIMGDRKSVV